MPFNGSGTFVPLAAPTFPAVAGTVIRSAYYNDQLNDIFAGLSNCLPRDGQAGMQADLDMGGFAVTSAQAANADGEALIWQQAEVLKGDLEDTYTGGVNWNTLVAAGVWRVRTVACFAPPFSNFPVFPNASTPAALGMLRVITGIADSTPTYCLQRYENGTGDIFIRFGTFSGTWSFTSWLACGLTAFSDSAHLTLGDALIAFRQSDANGALADAVGSTVHRKLQDLVTVKDFGADETGATNSSAAFIAAYAVGCVNIPKGLYKISAAAASIPSSVKVFKGAGRDVVTIKPTANTATFLNCMLGNCEITGVTIDVSDWVVQTAVLLDTDHISFYGNRVRGATVELLRAAPGGMRNFQYHDNILDMTVYPASNGAVAMAGVSRFRDIDNFYMYSNTHTGSGVVVDGASYWECDSYHDIQSATQIPIKLLNAANNGTARIQTFAGYPTISISSASSYNTLQYIAETGTPTVPSRDLAVLPGTSNKVLWHAAGTAPFAPVYSPAQWMNRGDEQLYYPMSPDSVLNLRFVGTSAANGKLDCGILVDNNHGLSPARIWFPVVNPVTDGEWLTVVVKLTYTGTIDFKFKGAFAGTINSTAGQYFEYVASGGATATVTGFIKLPSGSAGKQQYICIESTDTASGTTVIEQLWAFPGILRLNPSAEDLSAKLRSCWRFDCTLPALAAATQAAGVWTVASTVVNGPQLEELTYSNDTASAWNQQMLAGLSFPNYTNHPALRLDPFLDTTVTPYRLCCRVSNLSATPFAGDSGTISVMAATSRDLVTSYSAASAPLTPVPAGGYVDFVFATTNTTTGGAAYTVSHADDFIRQGVIAEVWASAANQLTFRYFNLTAGVINIPAGHWHSMGRWGFGKGLIETEVGYMGTYTLAAYTYSEAAMPVNGWGTTFPPQLMNSAVCAGDPGIWWLGSNFGMFRSVQVQRSTGRVIMGMLNITAGGYVMNNLSPQYCIFPGHSYAV